MKTYEVQKLHTSAYPYIVLSTSYISPLEEISSIEEELRDYKGKVAFDLLLTNGPSSNRFLEAEFDGVHFKYDSFKPIQLVDAIVQQMLNKFYRAHTHYVDSSVLSRIDKFWLKKGRI